MTNFIGTVTIKGMGHLIGKTSLVCGASQGIGLACAAELARQGSSVTLLARTESTLKKIAENLDTTHQQQHHYLCADHTHLDDLQKKVSQHIEHYGPFQILVNNTGGPPSGPIVDAKPNEFNQAFSNHVLGNQLLAQLLIPGMRSAGYGRIINIISTSVRQPIPGLGVSNTIRAAVANWAKTLAGELAPFGITVNNVLPGYIDTARLHSLIQAKADRLGKNVTEANQEMIARIPMGRLGKPEEIAAAVGFLASPAAGYVTGIDLIADGGRTAVQ